MTVNRRESNYETKFIKQAENMGWEVSQGDEWCDVVLIKKGRPAIAVEVKSPSKWQSKNDKGETPIQQAKRYAEALNTPIAMATDSNRFVYSHKNNKPLVNENGDVVDTLISPDDYELFVESNQSADFKKERLTATYKKINEYMMQLGVESGIKRAVETSKIIFIKMLSEKGMIELESWDNIKHSKNKKKKINFYLNQISNEHKNKLPAKDMQLEANEEKSPMDGIVNELSQFTFHRTKADVHGVAFQQFWEDKSAQSGGTNDLGQYFTPPAIVEAICHMAEISKEDSIYDPFCGTGGVLLFVFKSICKKEDNLNECKKFGAEKLFGTEISSSAALVAKMNMVLAGDGHTNINACDSLNISNNDFIVQDKKFDFVITNMPFKPMKSDDVDDSSYYKITTGFPAICNCIEHCINRTKSGGKLFIVTPQGFFSNAASLNFRAELIKRFNITAVIQLPPKSFAPYNDSDSSILCITKLPPEDKDSMFFYVAKDIDDFQAAAAAYRKEKFIGMFREVKIRDIAANDYKLIPGQYLPKPKHCIIDFAYIVDKNKIKIGCADKKMMAVPSDKTIRILPCYPKKGGETYRYPLQAGAIVVKNIVNSRKHEEPSIGIGIVDKDSVGHLITQEYHQLIPKNPKFLGFLYCFLISDFFQKAAVGHATGTGQKRIGDNFLRNISVPEPSLEMLKKYNAHVKTMIANQEKMQQLLSVKFDEFSLYHQIKISDEKERNTKLGNHR